jgi:polysaccharide export outer membrane protein
MIYRGNETMVTVELKALLDQGSPLADMRLKRDDIVYVTGRTSYVSILGQVAHPGNMRLQTTSTLSDLIAEAGGPTEKAGRNPQIQIIHRAGMNGAAHAQTVAFNSLLEKNALDLSLQSGDIVFVSESGFNKAAYTLEKLAPLVNLFTVAAVLTGTN